MSGGKLPEGWVTEKLNELAKVITKGTTPTTLGFEYLSQGIPFIKVENIDDFGLNFSSVYQYISEEGHLALKRSQFEENDVLFSIAGTIGKTAIVKNQHIPANTNQAVAIIRGADDIIAPAYLCQQLKLNAYKIFKENARGGAMNNVSLGDLKSVEIKFPNLLEQSIIIKKLDTLLAQVDSTKARLEQIPQILKRFRQAVLTAAVNGLLTEEWRNNIQEPQNFKKINFELILTELRNGLSSKPNEKGLGHPILRISSVRSGHVDQSDIRYLECSETELERHRLEEGDLLFTRYNGSLEFVGVCGLLKKTQYKDLLYPDKLIRARLKKDALPEYIEIFFSSPSARNAMMECVKTTSGQKGISGKDIKSQLVYLPSLKEQAEIVRRVEQLFAYADTIEKQVNSALTRVNSLTQSILAKAFRGELTAQWRAENPDLISGENSAAALLEKIKAERAASGGKKTARKKT